jgi:carbon storage regulator
MLVLSRKLGESIMIGDDIIVTIVEIGKGKVKIGIAAPKEIEIYRGEIYDKIQQQKGNGCGP